MKIDNSLEEQLDIIKDAILKHVAAKYIYLYGSYAYGTPHKDSDIDIYAVVPDDTDKLLWLYSDIMIDLRKMNYNTEIDLNLDKESNFNKYKKLSRYEGVISSKGRLLYEYH